MSGLIDTHCHLNFPDFQPDLQTVLDRASQADVTRIIVPGSDLPSSRKAVDLARIYPVLQAAVGIHPHDAKTWNDEAAVILADLAAEDHVVAIGEIGLDFYRNLSAPDAQIAAFKGQLALAARLGLPVIIHNRDASDQTLSILEDWLAREGERAYTNRTVFGIFHSFSGDEDLARRVLGLGFLIGISGPVTYTNRPAFQEVVAGLPLDKIVLETDAPYLTPHPHRGKRNEPAYVAIVAEKVASLKDITVKTVMEQTSKNVELIFGVN